MRYHGNMLLRCMLLLLLSAGVCRAEELVFAVSSGSAMPMTAFSGPTLKGGLLKDVGDALAATLQLAPRYVVVPRKRVEEMLQSGKADMLCDLRPEWLDGRNYLWSSAILSNDMVVAMRTDSQIVLALGALRGVKLGTVLGYRYPEVEAQLGRDFVRDNAVSDDINLAKLAAHRFDYILTNSLYLGYARYMHPSREQLSPVSLKIMSFDTYCAIKRDGKLNLAQLNRPIDALHRHGTLKRMVARYRAAPKL